MKHTHIKTTEKRDDLLIFWTTDEKMQWGIVFKDQHKNISTSGHVESVLLALDMLKRDIENHGAGKKSKEK